MNQRIRELAAIARGQAIVGTTVDDEQWRQHEQFVGKFAELIIKETLQVARAGVEFGNGMEDAVYNYFGVE